MTVQNVPRKLLKHYDLTAAQKLILASHSAIQAVIDEQSTRLQSITRRHLLMLLICKQANQNSVWFQRVEVKNIIRNDGIPIGSTGHNFIKTFNVLMENNLIAVLNPQRSWFAPNNFILTMFGESILRRLSYHYNRILVK